MGSPKPTRETASRDHSLEDDEILARFIRSRERECAKLGGSFNMPDRSLSYVDGAELQVCSVLGGYRVPFIEKDGHISFGESIDDEDENEDGDVPALPPRRPRATHDAHRQRQETDRLNHEAQKKMIARGAEERRRKREAWADFSDITPKPSGDDAA
jgi:hypothetical protein